MIAEKEFKRRKQSLGVSSKNGKELNQNNQNYTDWFNTAEAYYNTR